MRLAVSLLGSLFAVIMIAIGLQKIFGSDLRADMTATYEVGGSAISGWFFVLVGIFEIVIGVALALPVSRAVGGLGLAIGQAGAVVFNTALVADPLPSGLDDPGGIVFLNLVLLIGGVLIAVLWPRIELREADEND